VTRSLRARILLSAALCCRSLSSSADDSKAEPEPAITDRFAPALPAVLDDSDTSKLEAGEILVRDLAPEQGDGIGLLSLGLVDATPERVFGVLSSCEDQDEYMPRVLFSAVRDRVGDSHTCELVVDLPRPFDDIHTVTRHRVRRLPDGGYQRYWKLVPGPWSYLRDTGSWSVHPYAGGMRSLLINRVDLLLKSQLPDWLVRAAQTRQAPASFEAIRARVRERDRS
jgi:hypothetical protein